MDPSLVFKFWSQKKPELPDWDPELPEISGYSGISSGNSGFTRILRIFFRIVRTWNAISRVLGLMTVSKRYKPLFTLLSLLSHSLPCSLSPQTLETKNPPSTLDPRPKGASIGWWILSPAYSFPGRLGFKLLVQGGAHPKVNKLGFGKSLVLEGLNRFPPVNRLLMNPSTRV